MQDRPDREVCFDQVAVPGRDAAVDFTRPDGHRRGDRPPGAPLGRARVRRAELPNGPVAPAIAAAIATADAARASNRGRCCRGAAKPEHPERPRSDREAPCCARTRLPPARSTAAVKPLRGSSTPFRPCRVTAAADRAGSPCGPAGRLALDQLMDVQHPGSRSVVAENRHCMRSPSPVGRNRPKQLTPNSRCSSRSSRPKPPHAVSAASRGYAASGGCAGREVCDSRQGTATSSPVVRQLGVVGTRDGRLHRCRTVRVFVDEVAALTPRALASGAQGRGEIRRFGCHTTQRPRPAWSVRTRC